MKYLVLLLSLFSFSALAGPYLELGIGAHSTSHDGPEYTTRNALGIVNVGYSWSNGIAVEYTHISSLEGFPNVFNSPHEDGYGVNMISVKKRFDF